jgi:hypothetical protein
MLKGVSIFLLALCPYTKECDYKMLVEYTINVVFIVSNSVVYLFFYFLSSFTGFAHKWKKLF